MVMIASAVPQRGRAVLACMTPRSLRDAIGRISDLASAVRGKAGGGVQAGPGQAVADEFGAGGDAELGEDFPQVVVDCARAEEQLRRDLLVGQPPGDQPGALQFLRGSAARRLIDLVCARFHRRPAARPRPVRPRAPRLSRCLLAASTWPSPSAGPSLRRDTARRCSTAYRATPDPPSSPRSCVLRAVTGTNLYQTPQSQRIPAFPTKNLTRR